MSVEHMALVFAAQGLTGQEKLLLLALTNYTDAHGYCWPGIDRLAEDTGTSPATVKRTTQALIKKDLLRKKRRTSPHGHTITNMYRVNLRKLTAMRRPDRRYDDDLLDQAITFPEPTHTPSDQPIAQIEPPPAQSEPYDGSNRALVQLNLSPNPSGDPSGDPSDSSSSPSSTAEAVVPRQRTDQQEEEEEERKPTTTTTSRVESVPDAGLRDQAAQLVDAVQWPLGRCPSPVDRGRLVVWAARCLQAGHPTVNVTRELREAMSAQRPVGAAIARLRTLAGMPPHAGGASGTGSSTSTTRWDLPPCEHGEPGGNTPNASGVLRCPLCRRQATSTGTTATVDTGRPVTAADATNNDTPTDTTPDTSSGLLAALSADPGVCVACGGTDQVTTRVEGLAVPTPVCDTCWAGAVGDVA